MNKPTIAVLPMYNLDRSELYMSQLYIDCINKAGGVSIILPFDMKQNDIEKIDKFIDGYLFTGGQDVNPILYGENNVYSTCAPCRDELEKIAFEVAYKANKPMLGICRGAQFINVMLGGTLYQDLPKLFSDKIAHTEGDYPMYMAKHTVKVLKNTPFYDVFGEEMVVNSYHHQGINKLGDSLTPIFLSEDELVEGYYSKHNKFLMGVQFHPERTFEGDKCSEKIWGAFISSAKE